MSETAEQSYGTYAKQRLFRILLDLIKEEKNLNWSSMADAIHMWSGVMFQPNNFYRLKKGTLQDDNIEIIVKWMEETHDDGIRERLKPHAIFHEVGVATRDYYFHIPSDNFLDEWDEQVLQEFSGVYLCAPQEDKNSFVPLPVLRRWFDDRASNPELEDAGSSLDVKQYIIDRSIPILQRTHNSYFYAAEFPMSALFPNRFRTGDLRMVYEGVGVVSSNSILVQLRDCLVRVPKSHSIVINEKTSYQLSAPFGLKLFIPLHSTSIRDEWAKMKPADIEHFRQENAHAIEADYYLQGATQIISSPLPNVSHKLGVSVARGTIYSRKPADFLRNPELHFIRPELYDVDKIEKIIANPLLIGGLL